MIRRIHILIIFTVFLGAIIHAKTNVLFIMTDDLNCNIGAYGHPLVKTPHIDKLADEGRLFENAFCNFPLCGPSRASFMTGLYPEQNGVTVLRRLFRDYVPDAVTLSQHFSANGYTSTRVGKIYHYDNPRGIGTDGHDDPASWDHKINPRGRDKDDEDITFSLNPGSFGATLSWLAADGADEEQTDGMVATESIKVLKQHAKDETPFFLAVGFYKPHTPYVAPKKYFDLYDLDDIVVPQIPDGYLDTIPESAAKSVTAFKNQIDLDDDLARKSILAYYATISFVDAQIGRVLNALDELGLRENTVVVFSSDHGYHMGEHGHYQKNTLFEDADRVPLILRTPGMNQPGASTESFAEMIDFYKTLTELAGLSPVPEYVQGKSLVPVLNDPFVNVRPDAFTQLHHGYTLRTKQFRYSRWKEGAPNNIELYNRLKDPAEMVNLAKDPNYSWVIDQLDKRLSERIQEATSHPNGLSFTAPLPNDRGVSKVDQYY